MSAHFLVYKIQVFVRYLHLKLQNFSRAAALARHPPLRDSRHPEGYDSAERLTHVGNLLSMLCAVLAMAQMLTGNEFLYEQPGFGHMQFAFWWKMCLSMGVEQVTTPQCGYITSGPVYLKMTGCLYCKRSSYWQQLYRACTCTRKHT